MLTKDPLCPCKTGYEALGASTEACRSDVLRAFRELAMRPGNRHAVAFQQRLIMPRNRIVEDTLYYIERDDDSLDLSAKCRERTIEAILDRDPKTGRDVHTAAVLSLWWACRLAGRAPTPPDISEAWERAISLWTPILHSPDFWESWIGRRAPVYDDTPPELSREEVAAELRKRLETIIRDALQPVDNRIHEDVRARFEFEGAAVSGVEKYVLPFLRENRVDCDLPDAADLAPGFAKLCQAQAAAMELAKAVHESPAPEGIVRKRRRENACAHTLKLVLATTFPRAAGMLALTHCHLPEAALDYARGQLPHLAKGSDEARAFRYVAALACLDLMRASRAAGPDRVNELVDRAELALSLLGKTLEGKAAPDSLVDRLLRGSAPAVRDQVLTLTVSATTWAAHAFLKRMAKHDPREATHAINVLGRVYGILSGAGCPDPIESVARDLATLHVIRSRIHVRNGNGAEARKDMAVARTYDPDNPEVLKLMGKGER